VHSRCPAHDKAMGDGDSISVSTYGRGGRSSSGRLVGVPSWDVNRAYSTYSRQGGPIDGTTKCLSHVQRRERDLLTELI
jgi:hypothetical protein